MKKAFTLIELLVVIAIIAILAAILFPVFAQAKLAAKKSVDLSNLKQIGLAALMYSNDSDDFYPRNDYLVNGRHTWAPFTYREAIAPYVKNGIDQQSYIMDNTSQTGPLADAGIWNSPTQPPGRYGYGANQALFPSSQQWRSSGDCGNGNGDALGDDQTCTGAPTGNPVLNSVSQSQMQRVSNTLMITTVGINTTYSAANIYMQSDEYWWGGANNNIPGATIPPNWDADPATDYYNSDLLTNGPASALPRFRYTQSANVAWGDGHAKSVKKGALSWCKYMFVSGSQVNQYNPSALDDSSTFNVGGVCAGYSETN